MHLLLCCSCVSKSLANFDVASSSLPFVASDNLPTGVIPTHPAQHSNLPTPRVADCTFHYMRTSIVHVSHLLLLVLLLLLLLALLLLPLLVAVCLRCV